MWFCVIPQLDRSIQAQVKCRHKSGLNYRGITKLYWLSHLAMTRDMQR